MYAYYTPSAPYSIVQSGFFFLTQFTCRWNIQYIYQYICIDCPVKSLVLLGGKGFFGPFKIY